jgi:2-haloalkanoic acid dehalogenase type II
MSTRRVRAVVFDWYGTLAQVTAEMRVAVFDRVASDAGLDLTGTALGRRWHELARLEGEYPFDGPVPPFRSFRTRWKARGETLLGEHGVQGGGDVIARYCTDLHANAVAYPDAAEIVDRLRSRYRLGVLSDADTDFLWQSSDRSGLTFATVASSEDLKNYKPHIETFRKVCERLGVKPREAVFVGDQPRNDIAGARTADLRTIWINRDALAWPAELPGPDVEIGSLFELEAVLP